jgi:hypothetical protein
MPEMLQKATFVVSFVLSLSSLAHAKCDASDPRIAEQIKFINKKRDELKKLMDATKYVGKEVKRGNCAATLLRIGAVPPFALPPDEAVKNLHEAISCLALDKFHLVQSCKCGDLGLKYSQDEAAQIATLKAYKEVQALRQKAIKIGIFNKAIRNIVERADEIRQCFDMNTVSMLRKLETDLQEVIKKGQ